MTIDPRYDISATTLTKSDQLNADYIIGGPITVTISDAYNTGAQDQPVSLELEGMQGRPDKPAKTMRRVLEAAWGRDMRQYIGRSLTLFRDPTVKWGGQEVGGIRISHMSHIEQPVKLALTATKGKKQQVIVEPLRMTPISDGRDGLIADATTVDELRALWQDANENQRAIITARVNQLQAENAGEQA